MGQRYGEDFKLEAVRFARTSEASAEANIDGFGDAFCDPEQMGAPEVATRIF